MKLGKRLGLGPGHVVLDEADLATPIRGTHVIFGPCPIWPKAGWIKMPLGMDVGLGQGDFVLDREPASLKMGVQPPFFGPRLLWPNGWMCQYTMHLVRS